MILKKLIVVLFLMSVITAPCQTNVTKAGKASGQTSQQNKENTSSALALSLNKSSYAVSDTIRISIQNKSGSDIVIALRCGSFLEMSYQQSVKKHWTENKELPYMMMKCPTRMHTIKPHEKYECNVPSASFKTRGKFRFLIPFTGAPETPDQTITSVPFEIK
jgi:hypothetical protein